MLCFSFSESKLVAGYSRSDLQSTSLPWWLKDVGVMSPFITPMRGLLPILAQSRNPQNTSLQTEGERERTLKFWLGLKSSPDDMLQFKLQQSQELNPEKSPHSQLVLKLTNPIEPTHTTALSPALLNSHKMYFEHWGKKSKTQS